VTPEDRVVVARWHRSSHPSALSAYLTRNREEKRHPSPVRRIPCASGRSRRARRAASVRGRSPRPTDAVCRPRTFFSPPMLTRTVCVSHLTEHAARRRAPPYASAPVESCREIDRAAVRAGWLCRRALRVLPAALSRVFHTANTYRRSRSPRTAGATRLGNRRAAPDVVSAWRTTRIVYPRLRIAATSSSLIRPSGRPDAARPGRWSVISSPHQHAGVSETGPTPIRTFLLP